MEKFVEEPRHIEIQVAGTDTGKYVTLANGTAQFTPPSKTGRRVAFSVHDSGTTGKDGRSCHQGSFSYKLRKRRNCRVLVDKHRNFYFMEMNTRIQVEHGVTEEVVNYDLIKEQIKIAVGKNISGRDGIPQMHVIECRINAEDPYNDFRPSPGRITVLHQPGGHGVRVDSHAYGGYVIPPYYDSMIGKLISVAQTRDEAINTMSRALSEYIIEGIKTTIPFHEQLMRNEDFRKGNFTTKFLEGFKMKGAS